jgi:hypothetical protein
MDDVELQIKNGQRERELKAAAEAPVQLKNQEHRPIPGSRHYSSEFDRDQGGPAPLYTPARRQPKPKPHAEDDLPFGDEF